MNKIILLLACLLTGFSVVAAQPGSSVPVEHDELDHQRLWVEGYVTKLEYNQRMLTVSGQQFHVPIDAQIKNAFGGSNSFSLLQPRQAVKVSFKREKQGLVAYQIDVLPEGNIPVQH